MLRGMKLSIVVPVYNERKTIEEIVKRVMAVKISGITKEMIIVDDESTDGTREILARIKKLNPDFKIIYHEKNQGKGGAVRTGLSCATGDYIIIQDADLEYDPEDIPRLLKSAQEGKAMVVYGSRFTGAHQNMFFWHMIGNKFLSLTTRLLYNTALSDMEVCYKLFSRSSLKGLKLREDGWGFDPEITAKILKKGIRIYEVPIGYASREFIEGKKIRWQDAFRVYWALIKYRFVD